MTIEKTTNIERVVLAFRGDTDGAFKGAHVEYFSVMREDGVEIGRQPGRATTISEAAAAGFTWPDVAAAINAGALLTLDAQAAQILVLQEQVSTRDAQITESTQLVAQLQQRVLELEQQLGEQPQPDGDWRLQARNDLEVYAADRLRILTTLLSFYQQGVGVRPEYAGYAQAVFTAMAQIKDIDSAPSIAAVVLDPAGTRAQFDAAVKTRWNEIVAPAPTEVKIDFGKFGGKTL